MYTCDLKKEVSVLVCTYSIQAILTLNCWYGHVTLTSFSRRSYHIVRIGAYSLNNLRLGQDLRLGLGLGLRIGFGSRLGWVCYMNAQTAARFGGQR